MVVRPADCDDRVELSAALLVGDDESPDVRLVVPAKLDVCSEERKNKSEPQSLQDTACRKWHELTVVPGVVTSLEVEVAAPLALAAD